MEASSSVPPRKRRRAALACEPCRKKKIKCDREMPCDHCLRAKKETCLYLTPQTKGRKHSAVRSNSIGSQHASDVPNVAHSLSMIQEHTPGIKKTASLDSQYVHKHVVGFPTPRTSSVDQESIKDYSSNMNMPQTNLFHESPAKRSPPEDQTQYSSVQSPTTPDANHARPTNTRPILVQGKDSASKGAFHKARFYGQSHWFIGMHQFVRALFIAHQIGIDHPDIRDKLEACKLLARAIKTQEVVNQPFQANPRDCVPSKLEADNLVTAYLRTYESAYRVLHIPSFLREYDQYWESPASASPEFVMKLLLVMAIGSGLAKNEKDPFPTRSRCLQWINTAQFWLSSPFEKSRVNVGGVQVHCLLLLARQVLSVGADLVRISAGSLLTAAIALGLHINPSLSEYMSLFDAEMRRRLWATVLEIVVQSCADAGNVPLITAQDFDYEVPSNIDDTQIEESMTAKPTPQPSDTFTQSSLQIILIQSLPLRLEITKFLNCPRSESTYAEALRLACSLSELLRANSIAIQSYESNPTSLTTSHINLLNLLTHRFLLDLHHPFSVRATEDPKFYFSRKVSLDVSLSLLSGPHTREQRVVGNDEYEHILRTGGGIYRNVMLKSACVVAFEIICQLEEDKLSFTRLNRMSSRQELRTVLEKYLELSKVRLHTTDTSAKRVLLFSAVLAYIDAIISDTSPTQAIINALTSSLDYCYNVLKARSENVNSGQRDIGHEVSQAWFSRSDPAHDPTVDWDAWLLSTLLPA